MKSSVLAALLLALTTPLLSSEIPETNCREFIQNEAGLSLTEITELDLMQGIWVKKDYHNHSEMTFKFSKIRFGRHYFQLKKYFSGFYTCSLARRGT